MKIDVFLAQKSEGNRMLKKSPSITSMGNLYALKDTVEEVEIDKDYILIKLDKSDDYGFTHTYFHKDNEFSLDVRSFVDGRILPMLTFIINGISYGIVLEDSLETILTLWRWNKYSLLDIIKKYDGKTNSKGRQRYIESVKNTLKLTELITNEDELYLNLI